MTTYEHSLKEMTALVGSYKEIRHRGIPEEVQELRDRLSEELFDFGPVYAHIRAEAERAEAMYKTCVEEKRKYWKSKFGGERGTAGMVDTEAFLECRELQEILIDRNEDHYLAKSLVDRVDQVLNSISSRLKLTLKHE